MKVTWSLVLLWVGALLFGMSGATIAHQYQRHTLQHHAVEKMMLEQERINREFAQAINALAQGQRK
jgi:uncharacterized membrane protein YsdA (DUF1294 family)